MFNLFKKYVKFLLLVCFLLSNTTFSYAYKIQSDTNSKIKAIFIYNFAKYIKWPEPYENKDFLIAILGDSDPMVEQLNKMSNSKRISNRPFYIKEFSKPIDLGNPHIIYISSNKLNYIYDVIRELKGKSTLIITDSKTTLGGSAINFKVIDNRQVFFINREEIKRIGLKVDNILDNLAEN